MEDPAEHALVVKALTDGLGGGVEWDEKESINVINTHGLNPRVVRRSTIEFVRARGGDVVEQRREHRENWKHYDYYYMVIIPWEGLPHGLFVEMRLTDDDPDVPQVMLVDAHPECRR